MALQETYTFTLSKEVSRILKIILKRKESRAKYINEAIKEKWEKKD